VTVPCRRKGIPSELFHVVFPYLENEFDYLYAILCSTPTAHLLVGNDMVHELPLNRLANAILPWPEAACQAKIAHLFRQFDELAQIFREVPTSLNQEAFSALSELRDSVSSYLSSRTKHIEMLEHEFDTIASIGSTLADDSKKSSGDECENDGCERDAPEAILNIIGGLLDSNDSSESPVFDVVANTSDLAAIPEQKSFALSVCLPPPNQGVWTDSTSFSKDPRWIWGVPPRNKANYAWIMQTVYFLADKGVSIILMSNSVLVSSEGAELCLREQFALSGLLQCVISLPGGLFSDNRPPMSILILEKNREPFAPILFIDLQDKGKTEKIICGVARRSLPEGEVEKVLSVYRSWQADVGYKNILDYCVSVKPEALHTQDFLLAPWTYL
jgi:hypothetical protein